MTKHDWELFQKDESTPGWRDTFACKSCGLRVEAENDGSPGSYWDLPFKSHSSPDKLLCENYLVHNILNK